MYKKMYILKTHTKKVYFIFLKPQRSVLALSSSRQSSAKVSV